MKSLDFLASNESIISWDDVQLLDFDLCFPISSPPDEMLGIPRDFLAPEVAVGQPASPASDVWALGCSIFRMRSGNSPFASLDSWTPRDAAAIIAGAMGDLPASWGEVMFDEEGNPTRDAKKGTPYYEVEEKRSLRELVDAIYDRPENGAVVTGATRRERKVWNKQDNIPYPSWAENVAWKPKATKVDNIFLYGYDEESDELLALMPKIPAAEADLLYDLL